MRGRELVVATGDPQGIGPEVAMKGTLAFLQEEPSARVVLCGARSALQPWSLESRLLGAREAGSGLFLLEVPLPEPLLPRPPSVAGGRAALQALEAALKRVLEEPRARALVTAPLSKQAVSQTGCPFHGHTGWLAERLGGGRPVMLFVAGALRVALATVHLPLRDVPGALSQKGLLLSLTTLREGLTRLFELQQPRIAVLALNPHAGEGGLLGQEELELIQPAVAAFNEARGLATGPHSADSFFTTPACREADAVLAMYHDQGLVALKSLSFGRAVNLSLGLPILRTSVDHGCAFDLAGRGTARFQSMLEALRLAWKLLPKVDR